MKKAASGGLMCALLLSAACTRTWQADFDSGAISAARDEQVPLCSDAGPLPFRSMDLSRVEGDSESSHFGPAIPMRDYLQDAGEPPMPGRHMLTEERLAETGDWVLFGFATAGAATAMVSGAIALVYLLPCAGPTNCAGPPEELGWVALAGASTSLVALSIEGIIEASFASGGGDAGKVRPCHPESPADS